MAVDYDKVTNEITIIDKKGEKQRARTGRAEIIDPLK